MGEIHQITYNPVNDRLVFHEEEIHCGQVLSCLIVKSGKPIWIDVRFEYDSEWYIPMFRDVSPVGLWAKRAYT